ncbi:hypothetical protein SODG_004537 [Sodalis praecaptivus]
MKRQQSLVIKLTIFISISLIIIWLISVFAATYVSLNLSRHRILENLAHFSALRMELTNHRFEGAERDAQALAHRYKLYHATPLMILPCEKAKAAISPSIPITAFRRAKESATARSSRFSALPGRPITWIALF